MPEQVSRAFPNEPFDYFGSLSLLAATNGVVVSFTVPVGSRGGEIQLFGHGIDDILAWPTATFRIRRNFAAVQYYDNIRDQLGEFRQPQSIGPIPVRAGDIIDVVAENADVAAHLYAARLRGYFRYAGV